MDGFLLEDPSLIRNAAVQHFQNSFKEDYVNRPTLGGFFPRTLSTLEVDMLKKVFERKRFWLLLKIATISKVPGPDGFNFSFVKKSWSFKEKDMLRFFSEFYANEKLARGLNSTFIALIPKVDGASCFNEFGPISMIGCVRKILGKVLGLLAHIFKKVLPSIIGD